MIHLKRFFVGLLVIMLGMACVLGFLLMMKNFPLVTIILLIIVCSYLMGRGLID